MSELLALLSQYRDLSQSEREKGTCFERLIQFVGMRDMVCEHRAMEEGA